MVKSLDRDQELFSSFIDVCDHYSQCLLMKTQTSDGLEVKDSQNIKISKKGLKLFENLASGLDSDQLKLVSVDLSEKLIKKLKTKAKDEKFLEVCIKFLLSFRKILIEQQDLDSKFVIRIAKLLKALPSNPESFEVLKALAHYLSTILNSETIHKVMKIFKEDSTDLTLCLLFSFISKFSEAQVPEFLKCMSSFKARIVKKFLSQVFSLLDQFSSEQDTNSTDYFRALLLCSDISLSSPSNFIQPDSKLSSILQKSLTQSPSPKNYPQKLQLLNRLALLQQSRQKYIPGLLPHIYDLLTSHIFHKRSKSLRVSSVNLNYETSLPFEEQTSEKYKEALISASVTFLKSHIAYLKQSHPASLSVVKVQLAHLDSSVPSFISASLKSLIKL